MVLDKPGVGENLQDHLQLRMIYKVTGIKTLNEMYASLFGRAKIFLDYALRRRGPLTMAPSQLGIVTRSDPTRERANLQYHIQPLSLDRFGEPLHTFPAFTASVANVQPTSRGHIRLKSADPAAAPAIQPNYLSTDEDRRVAADSIRVTRRIVQQPALAGASSRLNICRANRSATTTRVSPRPPATSAPRSSIRSAPRRWAATPIRWRWWTSACACSASKTSA